MQYISKEVFIGASIKSEPIILKINKTDIKNAVDFAYDNFTYTISREKYSECS